MFKTLTALCAAIVLSVPALHAQEFHSRSVAQHVDRAGYRGGGGYYGHGHYFYYGGVPYYYPFAFGFGYPYYGLGYDYAYPYPYYGYGYGYPGTYEGRIVNGGAPPPGDSKGDTLPAQVQRLLAKRGYYKGSIDGDFGPASRRALSRFQADSGLTSTGRIDEPSLKALGFSDHQ